MKKNSEFIGVDENFIPQDEKYVDDNILQNNTDTKNKAKKFLAIGLGAYLFWILFVLVIIIGIFVFGIKQFNNAKDMQSEMINSVEQVQQDLLNTAQQQQQGLMNSVLQPEDLEKQNEIKLVTSSLEHLYNGTNYGTNVKSAIEKIITNNKKYKDNLITVVYQNISTTDPSELQNLKSNFDDTNKYEISFEYNDNGYIYQATIK